MQGISQLVRSIFFADPMSDDVVVHDNEAARSFIWFAWWTEESDTEERDTEESQAVCSGGRNVKCRGRAHPRRAADCCPDAPQGAESLGSESDL